MTSAEFDRAAAIFLAVRALPLADRPTRLDESCGADRALRAAVERLLAHDDGGDDEDDALTPLDEVVRVATAEALAPDLAGRVIGRVRIIRCIATGGMGSVYEGEQDEPRRRVAVKVLRPGLASPSMLHRFRHEAHLLGRLRHPGIVPIFDAGTTEIDGRRQPYLVMEYIEGPTLTAFAAERTLDDAARLRLIAAVCDAIEHAHQKGVIHRDLKPANILVDTDRDEPQPKILDFGIARTIEDDRFLTTMRTDVGQVLGTLAYMSPEQIAADPDALDTRSDVYAIGVIAYELLAGRLPLDLARRPLPDAARIVADTEPTPLGAIRRALRGDVETIVATAMEKERDRRYASAAMMAADLRRHLAGEPILARPPTMTYLLGRFARRHRALVGAVIAAFLLLVIAVVGTSTGLVRANAAARRAERMNEYLRGMIAWFDPGGAEGQAVTMAQVLDEAVARIDRDLVDEPAVAASLYTTLGTGYYSLLRLDDAERCLRHAIDCHAAVGESDSVESGEAHMTLGIVAMRRNALDEARTHIDAAIRIFTKDGAAAFELAQAQSELATLEKESDHLTEAEALFELALPVLRALDHEGGPLGSALNNWGALKRIRGDLPAAETLTREALEVVRRRRGDQHLDTAMVLNNLGFIISRQNRLADAEPLYRESLDIRRRLFGADSAQLAVPLNNLGKLYLDLDRLDDAEPLLDAALDIRRRTLGDHTHTANAMENLATVRAQRGRTVEAEAGFREALAMRGRLFAPDHQTVIASRIKLAKFLVGADRPAEAIAEVHVALDTLRGRAEPEPLVRFIALNTLALADQALQRYDEAAAAYTEALDAVRGTAIDGSDDANTVRANYATLLIDLGRSVEAEHLLRDAGVQLRANLPAMHSSVALTDLYLARALIAQGRLAEAEAPARDAYDVLHALRGPENGLTRDAARTLVALYEAWDRPADRATWAARLADEPPDPSPAP